MGHPVVMGRRTWDSLPERFRPLPGRRNVVVTRNPVWHDDGAERAASLEDALRLLGSAPKVFVIGGAELYAAALPVADELLLTEIDAEVEGDTLFPPVDGGLFEEVSREPHVSEDGIPFAFVRYVRRHAVVSRVRVGTSGWGVPVVAAGLLPGRARPQRVPLLLRGAPRHGRAERDEVPAAVRGAVPLVGGPGAGRLPLRRQGARRRRAPARDVRGAGAGSRRPARLRPRRRRAAA